MLELQRDLNLDVGLLVETPGMTLALPKWVDFAKKILSSRTGHALYNSSRTLCLVTTMALLLSPHLVFSTSKSASTYSRLILRQCVFLSTELAHSRPPFSMSCPMFLISLPLFYSSDPRSTLETWTYMSNVTKTLTLACYLLDLCSYHGLTRRLNLPNYKISIWAENLTSYSFHVIWSVCLLLSPASATTRS